MPFGKYRDQDIAFALRDAKYCAWLERQSQFRDRYPAVYEALAAHNGPLLETYFMRVTARLDGGETCIACASKLQPPPRVGDFVAAFLENDLRGRSYLLGVIGACCLSDASRGELARLRAEAQHADGKALP